MIKWIAKKIKKAVDEAFEEGAQDILCDFCDQPIDIMGPHLEYTMPEVSTQAFFHVPCHETNKPICASIIAQITAAGAARKEEVLSKLTKKEITPPT